MRSLKSGLFAIAFAGLFGAAAVVGCSADGGGSGIDQSPPVDPNQPDPNAGTSGSVVPPKTPDTTTEAGVPDAAKKDAGPKPEAGVDAGPPPPVEGTACSMPNAKASQSCGKCGKAETLCLVGDGGAAWGPYGVCMNEVSGGCAPGTTEACGNCGTRTCSAFCGWGACTGQPVGGCPAGSIDYTSASCTVPNTYQSRVCSATCQYGNYSGVCLAPSMTAGAAVGNISTSKWTLAASRVGKKPLGTTCPATSLSSTADYPYFAVTVKNPTNKIATVQVYNSSVGAGSPLDTIIWVYNGSTIPADDTAMKACSFGVVDGCDTLADICGNAAAGGSTLDWAGLDNVTIPANGTVIVYTAAYSSGTVGDFNLNIKTTKLQ
jgi:hypothetical protein